MRKLHQTSGQIKSKLTLIFNGSYSVALKGPSNTDGINVLLVNLFDDKSSSSSKVRL